MLLQDFEGPIRADLQQVYNIDLPTLFATGRYRHLLALIDGLPSHSRYVEALYANDEWREMIESQSDGDSPIPAPPLSTWTPEVNMLAQILDGIAVLTQTTVGVNGGKPKKIKPVPRPLTKKVNAEFSDAQKALIAEFAPGLVPDNN